jgi:hypothetical protein
LTPGSAVLGTDYLLAMALLEAVTVGLLVCTPVVVTRSLTERGLAGKPFGEGLRSEAGVRSW